MNKDEKNIFQTDVEVPPVVWQKADAAFLKIEKEGRDIMKKEKSVKRNRLIKSTAGIAACAALFVAAGVATGGLRAGEGVSAADGPAASEGIPAADEAGTSSVGNGPDGSGETHVIRAQQNFSLTAYAPEALKAGAGDDGLVFTDIGIGEDGFTGMLFQVQGEGIADVKMSIDKGELYTTTAEEMTGDVYYELEAAGMPDDDGNPDTHTVYQVIGDPGEDPVEYRPDKVIAYNCVKCGQEVTGGYDAGLYYGFYIPDDVSSSKYDLAEAYHERLGVFDGSVLKVSVTYTDGSIASREYDLSVKKLALDENRQGTQTEWKEGEKGMEEGYVYGVMAKEK